MKEGRKNGTKGESSFTGTFRPSKKLYLSALSYHPPSILNPLSHMMASLFTM